MVITNTRTRNKMSVQIGEDRVKSKQNIKYLGLQIDSKLHFTQHAKATTKKANKVVQKLSRLLPNVSMAKPRKRKLIGCVVVSILLFRAPNWADKMSESVKKELLKTQRKTNLRIASAYSTVSSTEASQVLADSPPIDLLAKERREVYLAKLTVADPEVPKRYQRRVLFTMANQV